MKLKKEKQPAYNKTNISKQQLEITKRQIEIIEYQNLISEFEHSPYFDFYIDRDELQDNHGNYLMESIVIENKGYPIIDYKTTIYQKIRATACGFKVYATIPVPASSL